MTAERNRPVRSLRSALGLEAMRMGVVGEGAPQYGTVGRRQALAAVDSDLALVRAHGGAVRVFVGDYGTGKTHLLEAARQRAELRGYVVASATLDPVEVAPSHPRRVYRALMASLRYPDQDERGIGPLLSAGCRSPAVRAAFGVHGFDVDRDARLSAGRHLYFSAALQHAWNLHRAVLRDASSDEIVAQRRGLIQWISGASHDRQALTRRLTRTPGHHPSLHGMADFRPWARIFGYLLSGLAALASRAGYRGLAVTLDEAEFFAVLSNENRDFALNLFRSWTISALGRHDHPHRVDPKDAGTDYHRGGQGILTRLPARYADDAHLYIALAATPGGDGPPLDGAVPSPCITPLEAFGRAEYRELCSRIIDRYREAYPDCRIPHEQVVWCVLHCLETGRVANPRQVMTLAVELLDLARWCPNHFTRELDRLQTTPRWEQRAGRAA